MPKGVYARAEAPQYATGLYAIVKELQALREADEMRIVALEKRIKEMNESFERGYLPPNVQAHS